MKELGSSSFSNHGMSPALPASMLTMSLMSVTELLEQAKYLIHQEAKYQDAQKLLALALKKQPENLDSLNLMGACLLCQNLFQEALPYFEKTLEIVPNYYHTLINMGVALTRLNRKTEAIHYYEQAFLQNGDDPLVSIPLGELFYQTNQKHLTLGLLERSLKQNPDSFDLLFNYATLCLEMDAARLETALDTYHKMLKVSQTPSQKSQTYYCLGNFYLRIGQLEKSLTYSIKAHETDPENATKFSTLLFYMWGSDVLSDADIFNWFLKYDQTYTAHLMPLNPTYLNTVDLYRPLRIGYVSGDFKHHSVLGAYIWLFEYANESEFEIFAYANNVLIDQVGHRIKDKMGPEHWREIHALSDEAVYRLIQQDQIDILVDLSGHTGGERLKVFGRKPAPIQVTGLGFGSTSGMQAMDYRITDIHVVPESMQSYNTEKMAYITSFFHFNATADKFKDEIKPIPAVENGYITFGSGNNPFKLSPQTLACWAKILQQVPNSKLHLKFTFMDQPLVKNHYEGVFSQYGIAPERLLFTGNSDSKGHRAFYSSIDIALDPFPYNGGASTLDALWMGRPVITLAGGTRSGVSIMNTMGHPEWVAQTPEDYVQIAVAMAQDTGKLNQQALLIRQELMASHLCKGEAMVREVEVLYRQMWETWCFEQAPYLQQLQAALAAHQNNDFATAEQGYRAVLLQHPNHPEALHGLGLLAYQHGYFEDAIQLLSQAIAGNPTALHYRINLGQVYESQGNLALAIQCYQAGLVQNADVPEFHEKLGQLFLAQQQPMQAIPHFVFLVEKVNPQNPGLHNTLGNLYRETGQLDAALKHYQQAIEIKPDYAIAHYNLGCWYALQQDLGQAKQCLEQALQLAPDFEPAKQMLPQLLAVNQTNP